MISNKAKLRILKTAANLLRLLLAVTLLFSGFVKANDPWGMVYKFEDYLSAIGLNIFPELFLLCCAVILATFEFCLGINNLLSNNRNFTARITTLFMAAMTVLTVYVFVANPVDDCGCFGDALILSNGATLAKNIVLLAASLFVLHYRKILSGIIPNAIKGTASLLAFLGIIAFSAMCIIRLPLIDFRPYKVGINLREAVESNSGNTAFDVKIIYEKDGKTMELDVDDDDPDSTWNYVETRRTPTGNVDLALANFCVFNQDGEEMTDDILYSDGTTLLLIIPDLMNADEGCIDRINELYDISQEEGYDFYCLTASADAKSQAYWRDHTGAEYQFCTADDRMLKTMVRGNPGIVVLRDGVITGKWSNFNMQSVDIQ